MLGLRSRAIGLGALFAVVGVGCGDSEEGAVSDGAGAFNAGGGGAGGAANGNGGNGGDPPSECGDLADGLAAACTECVEMSCCDEVAACASGTPCGQFLQCLGECSSQACEQGCASRFPDAGDDFNALGVCLNDTCESTCASGTGICGEPITTQDVDCDACLSADCCDEFADCLDDPTCEACTLGQQSGTSCEENAPYIALYDTCVSTHCDAECAN